ncbi:DUF6338 family protein [Granulicella arctica]|uniref:DUF6338 family protein n=1 Tax=Granulicella arctica TaxID=940613 RepID=UPI0021E02291|nr:DUF6338 family protein [Granulicella arctica]
MKFDVSTILLVIVAVIPGLFAQRTRNQLVPRSFAPQGASAELAELVALGVATHGILAFLLATVSLLIGWIHEGQPDYYFSKLDSLIVSQWFSQHIVEACLIASAYVFVSFFFSHWLGFLYGVWRSNSPFTTRLFAKATWLRKRFGVTGLLGERPIIYEVLNPALDRDGTKSVFVELEMKDGLGFYSGQLSQFAIVKDDEPHKPVYLIDVWYKKDRNDDYISVATDGIMIDLADAVTLLVKQVDPSLPVGDQPPISEEIAALAYKFVE